MEAKLERQIDNKCVTIIFIDEIITLCVVKVISYFDILSQSLPLPFKVAIGIRGAFFHTFQPPMCIIVEGTTTLPLHIFIGVKSLQYVDIYLVDAFSEM